MNKNILAAIFLVFIMSMVSCQNKIEENESSVINDKNEVSISIFKTDKTEFYSLSSIDFNTGKWIPVISEKVNYHKIDTEEKSVTFYFQLNNQNIWDTRKMYYDSLSIFKNGISFYYNSDYFIRSFLDTLNTQTIAHVLDEDNYIRFINLKRVKNSELENLNLIKESNEVINKRSINSNQQLQTENFEYSDNWRKEAFKATVSYLKLVLKENTPSCFMVKRSTYNSDDVRYIGQNGFRVKIYVEFDCNQNYINPSYFWVDAFYLGNDKWDLELKDQRLTH